jgi:pimeloyl-ACP methyl ester carboxylesterase
MGVGFGGHVLINYALKHKRSMAALVLVSPLCKKAGWCVCAGLELRSWWQGTGALYIAKLISGARHAIPVEYHTVLWPAGRWGTQLAPTVPLTLTER